MKSKIVLFAAAFVAALSSRGAEITAEMAAKAAAAWKGGGATVANVSAHTSGDAKFYVANYNGGGFAIVAGDDRVDPVTFYAPKGEYREDRSNALINMILQDVEQRMRVATAVTEAPAVGGRRTLASATDNEYAQQSKSKWEKLLNKPVGRRTMKINGDNDLEDIRVPKLVQSYWDQESAGGYGRTTSPCYNYYTPYNIYCGCVATAFAQVLRYHQWPQTAVEPITSPCIVGRNVYNYDTYENVWTEVTTNLTMIGGVYDWSKMPLETNTSTPEAQRKEIGKLCYDIGVSFGMSYSTYGSAANAGAAIIRLKEVFKYAQSEAIFWGLSANMTEYDAAKFQQMVIPSLEAGLPCVLTIYGEVGGHEVVCDGYGYQYDELFVHINAGYTGLGDAWYQPPYFNNVGGYTFTNINGVNYNISPNNANPIVSGRIVNENDEGIAGATVTLKQGSTVIATKTSNNKGSYFFHAPAGSYTITAVKDDLSSSCNATLSTPISCDIRGDGSYILPYRNVNIGNSVWNNIVLSRAAKTAKPTCNQASGTRFTGSTSVSFNSATSGATLYYTTDGSEPSTSSTRYYNAITLKESCTFKVRAFASGKVQSDIATFVFIETTLADALDCPNLPWNTDSSFPFTVQTTNVYNNAGVTSASAVQSHYFTPYCNSGAETKLWTRLKGPATLTFKYTYLSQNNNFYVLLDDDQGSPLFNRKEYNTSFWDFYFSDWEEVTVSIPAGEHKVTFLYHFNYGTMTGAKFQGVCLDQVNYTFTGEAEPILPVATPSANKPSGLTFENTLSVALSCTTEDAEIHYTLDGSTPTARSPLYSGAIVISNTTTLKAIAVKDGMENSEIFTATYTKLLPAATPTASPADGTEFESQIAVTLACETSGATIHYTIDGTIPTANSPTYNGEIILSNTTTVKAIAVKNGWLDSNMLSVTYNKVEPTLPTNPPTPDLPKVETPRLNRMDQLETLEFTDEVYLSPWSDTENDTVVLYYYTIDGSEPTMDSLYCDAVYLTETTTIKLRAFAPYDDLEPSDVLTVTYTKVEPPPTIPAETPTASPAGGLFADSVSVTLSCATDGATIYYTTNGTTPTNGSSVYSTALNLTATTTVKAIAVKDGMLDSGVFTATYTKMSPAATPTATPISGTTFENTLSVTLTSATSGATIYYTLDGNVPTTGSSVYSTAISLTATTTVKAIAVKSGMINSGVFTATYTKVQPQEPPAVDPTPVDPTPNVEPENEHDASEVVTISPLPDSAIDDIRVGALINSHWTQTKTVSPSWGDICFNYYTPGNAYCSCGATALAQIMRYHRYPTAAVTPAKVKCLVDNNQTELDLLGGVYNWDLMPPIVSSSMDSSVQITQEQREMIGRLCNDVGVAMKTSYSSGAGSGSNADMAMVALPKYFGYGSTQAIAWDYADNISAYSEELFKNIVIPNLDAGLPVVLSASGNVAHIFICDGYGYKNGKLYIHLNLGLNDGLSMPGFDGWYQPTKIWPNKVTYWWNHITGVVFNISPTRIDSLCSGRILDASGNPVEGATVKVMYGDWPLTNVTSNAKGIYVFNAPGGGQYKITASKNGSYGRIFKTIEPVASTRIDENGFHSYNNVSARVGNTCGNDITLKREILPTTAPTIDNTLGAALGTTGIAWTTSEDLPWTVVTDNSVDGSALKSYDFGSYATPINRESWLRGAVAGPANVTFKYAYGRGYNMHFKAFVDGTEVFTYDNSYGNPKTWLDDGSFTIPAGVHEVKFLFVNDSYSSASYNAAWLDQLNITYTATPPAQEPDPTFDGDEPDVPDVPDTPEQVQVPSVFRMDFKTDSEFSGESLILATWCETDDALIRYTVDGTEPTLESADGLGYIYLYGSATLKVKAFKDGMTPSETVTMTFTKIRKLHSLRILMR